MRVSELGYIGFGVTDPAAWERLATRVLGLQVVTEGADDALYLRMDERHHRIALHPSDRDELLYVGWQAPSAQAFDAIVARLAEAGVACEALGVDDLARRKVIGAVRFRDPGGYPCELFHSPLVPAHDLFRPSRPISGFRTGELGLGHLLGFAENVAEMERFYTDLFGFRVSDYALRGSVFLRCNPRHHSFGISPRGKGPAINHIMIETLSIDDVGRGLDLCEEEGFPVVSSLGRHTNDHMVSFYLETPSGFHLEYGCMGRLVDDETWMVHVNEWGDAWGHKRVRDGDRRNMRVDPAQTPYAHLLAREKAPA